MNMPNKMHSYGDFILKAAGEKQNNALSIVSHDLNSPLAGMIGLSKLIADQMYLDGADPSMIEMITRIVSVGENMQSLIDDITFMAKMEAGKEEVRPYWVDNLEDEMKETIKTFEFLAESKNLTLSLKIAGQLPHVQWDMTRLRNHVFNNIISNALKFTPEGGAITLGVIAVEDYVEIRIEDTGPGIPPGEEKSIFDRFGQLDIASERAFSGAGLGLYNARLFVEKHGGAISVDSSYKEGASFVINLPLSSILEG